jgi:hypothetical protein
MIRVIEDAPSRNASKFADKEYHALIQAIFIAEGAEGAEGAEDCNYFVLRRDRSSARYQSFLLFPLRPLRQLRCAQGCYGALVHRRFLCVLSDENRLS